VGRTLLSAAADVAFEGCSVRRRTWEPLIKVQSGPLCPLWFKPGAPPFAIFEKVGFHGPSRLGFGLSSVITRGTIRTPGWPRFTPRFWALTWDWRYPLRAAVRLSLPIPRSPRRLDFHHSFFLARLPGAPPFAIFERWDSTGPSRLGFGFSSVMKQAGHYLNTGWPRFTPRFWALTWE
jgi:hypothetical protein